MAVPEEIRYGGILSKTAQVRTLGSYQKRTELLSPGLLQTHRIPIEASHKIATTRPW